MDTFDNLPHSPEPDGVFRPAQPENVYDPAEPVNEAPRPEFLDPSHVFIRRGPAAEPQAVPEAPRSTIPDGGYAFRPEPMRETYRQPQNAPAPEAPARPRKVSPYADSPYVCQPRQQETPYYVPPKDAPVREPRKKTGFWRKALALYLGTDDEARIASVEDKAKIIGFTRLLRRAVRRPNEADSPAKIARCKEMLAYLLNKVDTLIF